MTTLPWAQTDSPSYKMGAGDIAIHIRRLITGGELLQGERLPPERAFAQQFDVSRGTVRDALRRLEEASFVEKRPGSGTYVSYSESDESNSLAQSTSPLELVDTRLTLEPQIVRLAVLNATEQNLAKTENALAIMEQDSIGPEAFISADEVFHLGLAECTKNAILIWITRRINEVRNSTEWSRMRRLTLTDEMIRCYSLQHRAIFEAVRARDADKATRSMRSHLGSARRSLVDTAS